MTELPKTDARNRGDVEDELHRGSPKLRLCLRCQNSFQSEWAGERICARCKSSSAWRSGIPVRASASGKR